MTINHVFFWASKANFQSLRLFYRAVLQPINYVEMICASEDTLIGYGSDYPYFWLKQLSDGKAPRPTHIAFDAPNQEAVDHFYQLALQHGGRGNGPPGIREEMSRQPYYAAFITDMDGNNVEVVHVQKSVDSNQKRSDIEE